MPGTFQHNGELTRHGYIAEYSVNTARPTLTVSPRGRAKRPVGRTPETPIHTLYPDVFFKPSRLSHSIADVYLSASVGE